MAVEVPYFSAAIRCLPGTELIATVPRRIAELECNAKVRIIAAPPEMAGFECLMSWHRRLDGDAAHAWLRAQVRAAATAVATHASQVV